MATFSVATLLLGLFFGFLFANSQIDEPTQAESGVERLAFWGAIVLLPLSGVAFRATRRQWKLRAAEIRELDDRAPVLYLRGFTDDELKIPSIVSIRRPAIEFLIPSASDRFEPAVTWELDAVGPSVAIAPPDAKLASLGAAREYAPTQNEWLTYVEDQIDTASVIVVSVGRTDGLLQELSAIRARQAEHRTMLFFPPVNPDELRSRWQAASDTLLSDNHNLELPLDPATVLVATIDDSGAAAVTADQRDEAGYRAAIRAARGRLREG